MSVALKTCFKCSEAKPLSEFYRHKAMGDGLLGKCKECTKKDARDHRNDNLEAVRAYDRERGKLPHRVAKRREIAATQPPERTKARNAVSNAVRDGRLEKRPCVFCGTVDPVEAHHHDYSKPLDVTWLCRPCHRRFHALERMAKYRDEAA